jgi:ribosomal protein L29
MEIKNMTNEEYEEFTKRLEEELFDALDGEEC